MAEFIPQGTGQQEAPPRDPSQFISPNQGEAIASAGMADQGPPQAPSGVPVGAGMGATQENPLEAPDEDAGEEEQKQYQDLFLRVMAVVNDTEVAPKAQRSMADEVIKMMSTKDKEAYVSIGTAAGLIMTQMIDNAKRQGVEFDGPVIQEVGIDLVGELIRIADMSGAINGLPEEDSEEYDNLMELAALEGSKFYGEYQIKTGQSDQVGHRKELDEQMQREADSGGLDEWGMEEMDGGMRDSLAQQITSGQGG